jgi:multiple sugar transport system permease protein/raffinose/stachyose/melibiose transport system permease protein
MIATRKEWWVPWAFLALPLAMFTIWVIYPIFQTFAFSLTSWDGISTHAQMEGFQNFGVLFGDRVFWISLFNNLRWLVLFVLVPIPLGLAIALLFNTELPGNKIFKLLLFLPMTLSFVVIGQVWNWIYEPDYGALNTFFEAAGLEQWTRAWLSDPRIVTYSLIFAAIWRQIPYIMILFLAGLKTIPPHLVEAAWVDGAGPLQRFRYVILPCLKPAMIIAVTVSIIDSLRSFDIVYTMTGGGPHYSSSVLANQMYIESFHNYRMGYGSAIAVIQFLITLCFIIIYLRKVLEGEQQA